MHLFNYLYENLYHIYIFLQKHHKNMCKLFILSSTLKFDSHLTLRGIINFKFSDCSAFLYKFYASN